MFDERVDFESNAPIEVFPYLGRLIGRAAVMKALASGASASSTSIVFVPLRIIIDEDQSAGVIVSIQLRQRDDRSHYPSVRRAFSALSRQQDRRIPAFLDTFEAVQQVLGREIDLDETR